MEKAHEVLKNTFGFASFRLEQEAVRDFVLQCTWLLPPNVIISFKVIRRLIVDNENALVLFPTGGG